MAENMEGENNIIEIYMCGGGKLGGKVRAGNGTGLSASEQPAFLINNSTVTSVYGQLGSGQGRDV